MTSRKRGTPHFDDLPMAVLPGRSQRIVDSAKQFGELLAASERHFLRGGAVVKLVQDKGGTRRLAGDEAGRFDHSSDFTWATKGTAFVDFMQYELLYSVCDCVGPV